MQVIESPTLWNQPEDILYMFPWQKGLEVEVEFPMGLTSKGLNVPKACDFLLSLILFLFLYLAPLLATSLSLLLQLLSFLALSSDSLRSPYFSLNCIGQGRQCSDWSGLSHVIELKSPKLDGLGERGFCYEKGWISTGWWTTDCAIMNAPICQLNIHTRTLSSYMSLKKTQIITVKKLECHAVKITPSPEGDYRGTHVVTAPSSVSKRSIVFLALMWVLMAPQPMVPV